MKFLDQFMKVIAFVFVCLTAYFVVTVWNQAGGTDAQLYAIINNVVRLVSNFIGGLL